MNRHMSQDMSQALPLGALALRLPMATRLLRWWQQPRPGRTAQDLHLLARQVEREMPGLAAELRIIAMHRPEAPE